MGPDKNKLIIADWATNGDFEFAVHYFKHLNECVFDENLKVIVCVPIQFINLGYRLLIENENEQVCIGAQNISSFTDNHITGEISAHMLEECGAKAVLMGSSARRKIGENDNDINCKIKILRSSSLCPIMIVSDDCNGEESHECMVNHIKDDLSGIKHLKELIIVYETNSKDVFQEDFEKISQIIRQTAEKCCKIDNLYILYGGNLNGANIQELINNEFFDGLFITDFSLKTHEFCELLELIKINKEF